MKISRQAGSSRHVPARLYSENLVRGHALKALGLSKPQGVYQTGAGYEQGLVAHPGNHVSDVGVPSWNHASQVDVG